MGEVCLGAAACGEDVFGLEGLHRVKEECLGELKRVGVHRMGEVCFEV